MEVTLEQIMLESAQIEESLFAPASFVNKEIMFGKSPSKRELD